VDVEDLVNTGDRPEKILANERTALYFDREIVKIKENMVTKHDMKAAV
jgi:hypothetical protein